MRTVYWVFRVVMWFWCVTYLYRYAFVSNDPRHAAKGAGLAILSAIDYWANLRGRSPAATGDSVEDTSDDKPLVSIVLLNKEHLRLQKEQVIPAVERAWNVNISTEKGAKDNFVVNSSGFFFVQALDAVFAIHDHPISYFEETDFYSSLRDARLRKAVTEHRAYASVDLLNKYREDDDRDFYPIIARLVVELADSRCLALYRPEFRQWSVFDDEVLRMLRSDQPMKPFEYATQPPILQVEPGDERMKAAVAEARRRFPEFEAAFEQRKADQGFYVKSEFVDRDESEFMWLSVTSIEGGFIYGRLDNDPASVKNVHAGQTVRVEVASLNDWMYMKDGEPIGGFTVKVLGEIEEE